MRLGPAATSGCAGLRGLLAVAVLAAVLVPGDPPEQVAVAVAEPIEPSCAEPGAHGSGTPAKSTPATPDAPCGLDGPSPQQVGDDPVRELRRAAYRGVFRAPVPGGAGPLTSPLEPLAAADPVVLAQLAHLEALLGSRPYSDRVPAQALATALPPAPGEVLALRAVDGSYLMVWSSAGSAFTADTASLSGERAQGWWFDPRTGTAIDTGEVQRGPAAEFHPPVTGPQDLRLDWVLVVDDATWGFGPPGGPPTAALVPPGPDAATGAG
jgi:hypothetical protein